MLKYLKWLKKQKKLSKNLLTYQLIQIVPASLLNIFLKIYEHTNILLNTGPKLASKLSVMSQIRACRAPPFQTR